MTGDATNGADEARQARPTPAAEPARQRPSIRAALKHQLHHLCHRLAHRLGLNNYFDRSWWAPVGRWMTGRHCLTCEQLERIRPDPNKPTPDSWSREARPGDDAAGGEG